MTGPRTQPAPLPPGARLVDPVVFRTLLEMEIAKAQRLRYCLAVLCLVGHLAPDADGSTDSLAGIAARRLRSTDVVLDRGPAGVVLLLIDADVGALPAILHRVIADFQAASWSAGASSYPKNASNSDELLAQAVSMLSEAERDGGRQLFLQR
jgi:hypothetical protein